MTAVAVRPWKGYQMKVTVDTARCQGHGLCYMNAPHIFSDDADGYSTAPDGELPSAVEEDALDAADGCPELAIRVSD